MPIRIFKYTLEAAPRVMQPVGLPIGAHLIHVANQYETITFWAEADEAAPLEDRYFTVVGTGHKRPANSSHVGSALFESHTLVWHVYEVWPDV